MKENALKDKNSFVRLAEKRVNKTINYIRLLGNLSNRTNYKYEERQVKQIFNTLREELKEAEKKFYKQPKERFSL